MVVYASNTLRGGLGAESVSINLSEAVTVSGYVVNGNITAWKIYGNDTNLLDQQSLQYTLKYVYTLPTIASTYTKYTLVVTQVNGDTSAKITKFKLTNEYNTLLVVPELTTNTGIDYKVVKQDIILTNDIVTGSASTIYNNQSYPSTFYRQCNVISNIVCSNVFYTGTTPWYLFGSKDRGSNWSNLIATNTSVSSNSDAYNCFRLLSPEDNGFIITDPINNIIHANASSTNSRFGGGNYIGKTITSSHRGEWVEIDYGTTIYANSYSVSFPSQTLFASHWKILGNAGSNWNLISEVSNIYSIPTTLSVSYQFNWPNSGYIKYRIVFVAMYGSSIAKATKFLLYDDMGKRLVPKITSTTGYKTNTTIGVPTVTISQTRTFVEFATPVSVYKFANLSPCTTGTIIAYKDVSMSDSNICVNSARNYVAASSNTQPFKIFEFTGDYRNSNIYSNVAFIGRLGQLNEICDLQTGITTGPLYGGLTIPTDTAFKMNIPNSKIISSYTLVPDPIYGIPVSWDLKGRNDDVGSWTTIDSRSNLYNTGSNTYIFTNSSGYTRYGFFVYETRGSVAPSGTNESMYFKLQVFQMYDTTGSKIVPLIDSTGTSTYSSSILIPTNIDGDVIVTPSAYATGSPVSSIYNITDYSLDTFFQSASTYNPSGGEYIQIQFLYPVIVVKFAFAASISPPTCPKTFKFEGSNDGYSWSALYTQSSPITPLGKNGTFTCDFTNSTSYKYYRFTVLSVVSGACFQLSMFRIYSANGPLLPIIKSSGSKTPIYGGTAKSINREYISIKTYKYITPSYIFLESKSNCLPSNVQIQYTDSTNGQLTNLMYYEYYGLSNTLLIPLTTIVTSNTFRVNALSTQQNVYGGSAFSLSKYQLLNMYQQNLLANIDYTSSSLILVNSNVYYPVTNRTNIGGKGLQYITLDSVNSRINGYYVNFTGGALTWNIAGSVDNGGSWTQLDSRTGVNDVNEYRIYLNTPTNTIYPKIKLAISNTFSGYDSIGIKEFYIINDVNDRLTYDGTTSNLCYSGSLYNKSTQSGVGVYYGEYLIFTYPYTNQCTNIRITATYPIREVVLLGKKSDTSTWVYISTIKDETFSGTFIFSGSAAVDYPIRAFTDRNTIMSRDGNVAWVQIETPYPLRVTSFEITPYDYTENPYDPVGSLNGWNISGSTDGVTFNTLFAASDVQTSFNGNLQTTGLYKYYRFTITSVQSGINFGVKNIKLFSGEVPLFGYNTGSVPNSSVVNINVPGVTIITSDPRWDVYKYYALVFTKVETKTSAVEIPLVEFTAPNTFPRIRSGNFVNTFNYPVNTSIGPDTGKDSQYVILESDQPVSIQSYSFNSIKANVWTLYGSSDSTHWVPFSDAQYNNSGGAKGGTIVTGGVYSKYKLVIDKIITTSDIDGCVEVDSFKMKTILNSCTFPLVDMTSNITYYSTTTLPGFRNSAANPLLTIQNLDSTYAQPRIVETGNFFQE